MKKLLAVLLVMAMVLSAAACGGTGGSSKALADEGHAAWVAHGQYLLSDGTENSWNGKDTELYEKSALTAIKLDDVKAIDEDLYKALSGKEVKYLYKIDLIFGTNDAGWTTDYVNDGKLFRANGSYAFKIAQCTVDVDGDNKVYAEDQWISDPKTAHAESLTPATMYMPVWQEEPDEFGLSWASNPVVTGGPGLYTLVIAQYKNASSPEQAGYGIGLVLKEKKDGLEYEEVLEYVPADHTYGIVGGFAASGWGSDGDDVPMEADGENKWVGEVELAAGDEFKVRADGDWTYSWGDGENNLVAEADGTYVVTITFDGDATVTAELKE
ncbi:MAG: hypothetical protein IJL78_03415 [Lachnospiraceae bacterium]|nr:hypothetical protein [Lachnospiraceae bacterium]